MVIELIIRHGILTCLRPLLFYFSSQSFTFFHLWSIVEVIIMKEPGGSLVMSGVETLLGNHPVLVPGCWLAKGGGALRISTSLSVYASRDWITDLIYEAWFPCIYI